VKYYAEYAVGGVFNRGLIHALDNTPQLFGKQECYRSLFIFPESEIEHLPAKLLTSDAFLFDFDSEENLLAARDSVCDFVEYLRDSYIPLESIYVSFSGNKGFHVAFSTRYVQANIVVKANEYVERYRRVARRLAEGFSCIDLSIYNQNRLIRVVNTQNKKTGLYKIPLTFDEVQRKHGISFYLELAKQPRKIERSIPEDVEPIEQFAGLFHAPLDRKSVSSKEYSVGGGYAGLMSRDAPEGERHNTLIKLVGHLRRKGLPVEEALVLLMGWNNKLSKPLEEKEVERTVRSLFNQPSNVPTPRPLVVYTGADIIGEKEKPTSYLVRGLVGHPSLNILFGEEGAAKSMLMANLALSVAGAREKWLSWDVALTGAVIYVDAEMDTQSVKNRFIRMSNAFSPQQKSLLSRLIIISEPPFFQDFKDEIIELCETHKPVLIIFDDLYFLHSADENNASEMKEIMGEFRELRDKFQTTVFVVHHTRKGEDIGTFMSNKQMRGSQVLGAIVDSAFQLKYSLKEEGKVLFKPTKFRHISTDQRKTHILSLDKETLWLVDEGVVNEKEHLLF